MSEKELSSGLWENCKDRFLGTKVIVVCCLILSVLIFIFPSVDNHLVLLVVLGLSIVAVRKDQLSRTPEIHQILLESIQHNPTAFAVYDSSDQLIVWNDAYESLYRETFQKLRAEKNDKIYYSDLTRCNASREFSGVELEQYVKNRVQAQREPGGSTVDRLYPSCGWFRVSKFVTPSGGVAGFAIDINELKQREVELIKEIEQRRKLELEIRALANTDSLTGIANRRFFIENAVKAFDSQQNAALPLIVLMVDIDHFKSINDAYGHAIGDDVIRFVAKAGAEFAVTGKGVIGRLGGEEFALIFTNHTLSDGISQAEKFRIIVNNKTFTASNAVFNISISIGMVHQESVDPDLSALLKRADEALYQVKADGRNSVVYQTVDKAA